MKWITASDIKNWANTKQKDCAQALPELTRRLIFATAPASAIQEIDFPSGDSTSSGGWDGRLKVADNITSPFFPSGGSVWEIGAEKSSGTKVEEDYVKRTADPLGVPTKETTYVGVTPRTFPERGKWQEEKQQQGTWKGVRVIAADSLEIWLDEAPAVALWLARRIGNAVQCSTRDLEDAWNEWSLASNPKMTTDLVIAGRVKEAERVQNWIAGRTGIIEVQGDSPDEALAFFYASIAAFPEQDRVAALSRCVVVENLKEFRSIQAFRSPLIIAVSGECAGAAAAAVAKGHQVYISMDATVIDVRNEFIKLSRPQRDAVEAALRKSGLSQLDADQLARDFGRSIPVLHRNLSVSSVVRNPAWASSKAAQILLPALFAGSWSDSKQGDCKVLETLSRMTYQEFVKEIGAFLFIDDAPIRKVGTVWTFKSPLDAWFLLARHLDGSSLKLFKQVVHSVLTETDPKYELETNKRWSAGMYGKVSQFSEWLRTGLVESLILLAIFGDRSPQVASTQAFVNDVVNQILSTAHKWESWSSLKGVTPLLAEAAPYAFLDVLEELLQSTPAVLTQLMVDDAAGILFGECKHSGLLWALESLAWSSDFFVRATTILATLMRLDPGGRWSNRPGTSLYEVFLPGYPQTHATPDERLAVLQKLADADPVQMWQFTHRYFTHGIISESHTFRWRYAGGQRRGLQTELVEYHNKYVKGLVRILLHVACAQNNLATTAQHFHQLPVEIREEFVKTLASANSKDFEKANRERLLANVRDELNWINSYGSQEIRIYEPILSDALERLASSDVFERFGWLLGDAWPRLPEGQSKSYTENHSRVTAERQKAAREVLDTASLHQILEYGKTAKHPGVLGNALAKVVKEGKEDDALLDAMSTLTGIFALIRGYSAGRVELVGQDWVLKQIQRLRAFGRDSVEVSSALLNGLPEGLQTWSVVADQGQEVEEAYWKKASGRSPRDDEKNTTLPAQKLLAVKRPYAALELVGDPNAHAPGFLLKEILNGILTADRDAEFHNQVMDVLYLGHVFNKLHEDKSISLEELARLEAPFAALFNDMCQYTTQPFAIHRVLQREPRVFSQLISYIYKRDDGKNLAAQEELSQQQIESRANIARETIESWTILPGLQEDGSLNEEELSKWVETARTAYADSGHTTAGDLQIGLLLSRTPSDSDGLWPHIAVRNLLENLRNNVIDQHIPMGIYNGRGVVSRGLTEGGVQERKLSEHYKKMSDATKAKWPRTSAMLLSMAEWYESDAKREDISADLNELRFG